MEATQNITTDSIDTETAITRRADEARNELARLQAIAEQTAEVAVTAEQAFTAHPNSETAVNKTVQAQVAANARAAVDRYAGSMAPALAAERQVQERARLADLRREVLAHEIDEAVASVVGVLAGGLAMLDETFVQLRDAIAKHNATVGERNRLEALYGNRSPDRAVSWNEVMVTVSDGVRIAIPDSARLGLVPASVSAHDLGNAVEVTATMKLRHPMHGIRR